MIALRTGLCALLSAVLAVGTSVFNASPAEADVGEVLDVSITSISTPIIDASDPKQTVEISGTLENSSGSRIRYVNVHFWRSQDPITTSGELHGVLGSDSTEPLGSRLFEDEENNLDPITGDEFLEPNETFRFEVRATVEQLGLPQDEGVYLLGVHVRGIPEGEGGTETVGRGRILAVATSNPLETTRLVKLTAPPTRLSNGDFVDDSLEEQLSGRLDALLDVAEQPGTGLLIDPSLLDEAKALAEPHTVADEEMPADKTATEWVARLEDLVAEGDAYRLPFADPALPRALAAGDLDAVQRWAADCPTSGLDELPVAVDLGDGADETLLKTLEDAGIRTFFANNAAGESDPEGLVPVASLRQDGMGPGDRSNEAQRQTRRLAEEFVAATPRVYLVRSEEDAELLQDVDSQHRLVPIADGSTPAAVVQGSSSPIAWNALSDDLSKLRNTGEFFRDLTGEDDTRELEMLSIRAYSAAFAQEDAALEFMRHDPVVNLSRDQVHIAAARQFVMASRTSNFPVTITNEMPMEISIRLAFDSDSPQRIDVPRTDLVKVGPGENLTLNVSPEATANGVVEVTAHLETPSGVAFGKPVPIEITATDFGRVGWIIVIVSGAVVLAGTFWRIRTVQAEHSKKEKRGEQSQ